MQPHPIYALWWKQVEACTGANGALEDVEWYVMPSGRSLPRSDGSSIAGMYEGQAHRITMTEEHRLSGMVVRHEMAHALAARSGHTREAFLGACEGVVNCEASCLTEAGPPPEMGLVPRIPPEDLGIAIAVEPATPSTGLLDGHLMLVITVTNPYPYDVVVTLPPSGDPGLPIAFSYSFSATYGVREWFNGRITDAGTAQFSTGQVKRAVFDLQLDESFEPGHYIARGGFSSRPYPAEVGVDILP